MTLSELKALNERNGGYFFSRNTMKFFGDTMKNFGLRKTDDPKIVEVYRKKATKHGSAGRTWKFNTETGRNA